VQQHNITVALPWTVSVYFLPGSGNWTSENQSFQNSTAGSKITAKLKDRDTHRERGGIR